MVSITLTQEQLDSIAAQQSGDGGDLGATYNPVPKPPEVPNTVTYKSCTDLFGKELPPSNYLSNGTADFKVPTSILSVGIIIPKLSKPALFVVSQRATGTAPYRATLSKKPNMSTDGAFDSIEDLGAGAAVDYTFPAGEQTVVYFNIQQKNSLPMTLNLEMMLR